MKPNGGPAFPYMPQTNPGEWAIGQSGMTMRQWYKGMALMGELAAQSEADGVWLPKTADDLTERCAAFADAMLAEDEEASRE
jgi:hypothetical protein